MVKILCKSQAKRRMIQSKELGIATATSKPTTASEDEKLLRAGKLGGAAEEEGAMDEIYLDGLYRSPSRQILECWRQSFGTF